jgi:hypothetical protein
LLDGNNAGHPGSNYVTVVNRHNLVWSKSTPRVSRFPTALASRSTLRPKLATAHRKEFEVKSGSEPVGHGSRLVTGLSAWVQKVRSLKPARVKR